MNTGNKIKNLRVNNQMTQEQLAEKLHVTRNAISKWETNKGIPNIDSLLEIAKIFNVTIDSLFSDQEIVTITLENQERSFHNRNLGYSIILLIVYAMIGILIPHYCFKNDPTSGMALFIIFLPLSYIILGIITGVLRIPWPYVVISAGLGLTPIYFYFESLPTVTLGAWGIGYLVMFYGSYLLVSIIIKSPTANLPRLRKLFRNISIGITLIYLIHTTINCISLYKSISSSFPWYSALFLNTLLYLVPLSLAYSLFFYFNIQLSKSKKIK